MGIDRKEGEDDFAFWLRLRKEEYEQHKAQALNFRGRRYRACRAVDDLLECINHLGEQPADDKSVFDATHNVHLDDGVPGKPNGLPVVTNADKQELRNMARLLLRMILHKNDQGPSPAELRSF